MQEFRVIHTKKVEENWEYIVTATDAAEALKKVVDGKIACTEHWYEPGTEYNIGDFVVPMQEFRVIHTKKVEYSSDLQ